MKKIIDKIKNKINSTEWTTTIKPKTGWFDINLRELWQYRDLIKIFVYRDFVVYYKQTILGPLWWLIKPLFTTFVYTIISCKLSGKFQTKKV